MADPALSAQVSCVAPPSNPMPASGDAANLLADDPSSALWNVESSRPVTIRYAFSNPVRISGYVVAPPPDYGAGATGWEISMYEHGLPSDGWNRLYHDARGVTWDGSGSIETAVPPVDRVGIVDVTFGQRQRFGGVGFSRFFFRGS